MIRFALTCEDRLGVTQEVLSVLVRHAVNLRGIELESGCLYLKLLSESKLEIDILRQHFLAIPGIHDVEQIDFLPGEREHQEFATLLACFPEAVATLTSSGKLLAASAAFYQFFNLPKNTSSITDNLLTTEQLSELFTELSEHGNYKQSRVLGDKPLLIEAFPVLYDESPEEYRVAVVVFKEPSEVAAQLERWQRTKDKTFEQIVAVSSLSKQFVTNAQRVATSDAPLLITGETGTGKELIARATHRARTPNKPFLALNCASLPDSVAEQELFGHGSDAFDGASKSGRPGLLELADGGTLYFDEIGEMSPYLQVKLLRFLEEGAFRRVGTDEEVRVKVKIIASTQRDLSTLIEQKLFREDLYYRLNVLNLEIPPLRKRKDDILPLADYFITTACQRIGKPVATLSQRAAIALSRYNWPGNVRELENIIFRAVSLATTDILSTRQLNMPMLRVMANDIDLSDNDLTHKQLVSAFERQLFEYLYPSFPSSRKLAGRLGLSHTAVAKKLKKYHLE
ncbi:sigma 54-interacting transcriptional regulator [Pleionea sediminis]|uniref:sigma 54-interacting transcriptional regulator n=1 Tax=Pleionea sediminis TaxID=2569479 RepID=UPI001184CFA8|nr:sigma 54-interacting transcriptional regulator [Pleionea sediminis]